MKLNNNLCKTMTYLELHKKHSWNNTLEIVGLKFEGINNIKFYFFVIMQMQTNFLKTLQIWKIVKIEFGGLNFFHIYLLHYHSTFHLFYFALHHHPMCLLLDLRHLTTTTQVDASWLCLVEKHGTFATLIFTKDKVLFI
jgi:hypothetical protein